MDQIIIVNCSEDGDVSMRVLSEAEFLDKLNKGEFGSPPKFLPAQNLDAFYTDLRQTEGIYVIKGKFVEPKPVQVVTEYKL